MVTVFLVDSTAFGTTLRGILSRYLQNFGTIFMTPGGLLEQGSSSLSEKQKQALAEYYIPYDYWYTPLVERDHHVDFTQMPEEVADILRMVDELLVEGEAFHMNEQK